MKVLTLWRLIVVWCCVFVTVCCAGSGKWLEGKSPQEVGSLVAQFTVRSQMGSINYQNVCCAYGVLKFARVTGDTPLRDKVEAAYSAYLSGDKINERNNHQGGGVVAHFATTLPSENSMPTNSTPTPAAMECPDTHA